MNKLPHLHLHSHVITENNMLLILLVLLIVLFVGAWPRWPYSAGWGYGPTGGLGLVLLIVVLLYLFG
jgi:hypothetical protein